MAPKPIKTQMLAVSSTKKKDPEKRNIPSSHKVETRRTSALKNAPSKGKEVAAEVENEGELSPSMDTEEEDNEGLFSTPKRGSTPGKPQVEPSGQVPSVSVFSAPENLPAPPIFVLPAKSQGTSVTAQQPKINLKRPADPLGGSPIRKTARTLVEKSEIESQMSEILKVVKNLSQIVDKQTLEIQELKKLVKGANKKATEATLVPVRESSTMASHLAAVMAASPQPENVLLSAAPHQAQAKPAQPKGGPNLVIDLSDCDVSVKERTFLSLRKHLESSLQGFDETRNVVLKGMNKDGKREHRFFLFFNSDEDEKKARIHARNWLSTAFPRGNIQSSVTHKVKVNNVRADAVIDLSTNRPAERACHTLSQESGYSIARIGWLSGPGKKYGSMVVHFTEKKEADEVLARGLMEVGGESACATVWTDKPEVQRCFNCQQFGHLAGRCQNTTICGNCATSGHSHKDCTNTMMKCANCQGQHRANDSRCPRFPFLNGENQEASNGTSRLVQSSSPFSRTTNTRNAW